MQFSSRKRLLFGWFERYKRVEKYVQTSFLLKTSVLETLKFPEAPKTHTQFSTSLLDNHSG